MANAIANAVDWYLNKLNVLHLLPANGATLARDVASKQLSDGNFTPRPLTVDNFTDDELYALDSLARQGDYKAITSDTYDRFLNRDDAYGNERNSGLAQYLSPVKNISTTLGQAAVKKVGDDYHIVDTYDFNRPVLKYTGGGGGGDIIFDEEGLPTTLEEVRKGLKARGKEGRISAYSRFRTHAARFGHVDADPDHQKIHADISLKDIRRRLGDKEKTLSDINRPISKKDFVMRLLGAGAITGAPLGALAGALSGAILLIDKNKRKKWFRTMLTHVLGGAAIGGILGAAGGGYSAHKIWDRFAYSEKKASHASDKKRTQRARKIRSALLSAIAYATPAVAMASAAGYGINKARDIYGHMLEEGDDNISYKVVVE